MGKYTWLTIFNPNGLPFQLEGFISEETDTLCIAPTMEAKIYFLFTFVIAFNIEATLLANVSVFNTILEQEKHAVDRHLGLTGFEPWYR